MTIMQDFVMDSFARLWKSSSVSVRCSILSNVVFWMASLLGLYADHLVATAIHPQYWLTKYKLQRGTIITGKDRRDLVLLASFNMIFVTFFVCCPIYQWLWNRIRPPMEESEEWIGWYELLVKLPIHMMVTEGFFYGFHYLLHSSPFLYQHIHKVHHRFVAPTAMACVYAHPIEFALANVFPIYAGPILTHAHPITCYIWFCLTMLGTCKGHSGYRIFFGHADYHEEHHYFGRSYNFGGMYLSDYLLGTLRRKKFC